MNLTIRNYVAFCSAEPFSPPPALTRVWPSRPQPGRRNSMIFSQQFDRESSTYTYVLASRPGGEALIIDPVIADAPSYARLLRKLDVRLVFAIDTHVHADHVTGLGTLREQTECVTVMGEQSRAECVSRRVHDGEVLRL